ncbi:MAG: carboxypeptidase-like regulatory domain-containing protein, partial [Flavobacteriales bacterium]
MNFSSRIFLVSFTLLLHARVISQKNEFTISGTIKDAATGEYLTGALFAVPDISKGRNADVYGFYSLTIPRGDYKITYSMLGYKTQERQISLAENMSIDIALETITIESNVVEIESGRGENTKSTDMGKIGLEIDQVKKLPVLLGEIDILKTITLLPGVKSSGEGNAGFYVRGGGVDQNLILLDNATVYNASHLFGFFSVFNADAVKDLELTKGGIP